MSEGEKYRPVGTLDLRTRSQFPLMCGCCGRQIPDFRNAWVYFDSGPGDFFIVDKPCAEKIKKGESVLRPYG